MGGPSVRKAMLVTLAFNCFNEGGLDDGKERERGEEKKKKKRGERKRKRNMLEAHKGFVCFEVVQKDATIGQPNTHDIKGRGLLKGCNFCSPTFLLLLICLVSEV